MNESMKEIDYRMVSLLEKGLITKETFLETLSPGYGSVEIIGGPEEFAEVTGGELIRYDAHRWEYVETQFDTIQKPDDYEDKYSFQVHYLVEEQEDKDGNITPYCFGIYVEREDGGDVAFYEITDRIPPCNFYTLLFSTDVRLETKHDYTHSTVEEVITGIDVKHYAGYFGVYGDKYVNAEAQDRYMEMREEKHWDKVSAEQKQSLDRIKLDFAGLCKIYDARMEARGVDVSERVDTNELYLSFADAMGGDDRISAIEKLDNLVVLMGKVEEEKDEFMSYALPMYRDLDYVFSEHQIDVAQDERDDLETDRDEEDYPEYDDWNDDDDDDW